jgi:ABC-type transporter Mla MlaB component
MSLGKSRALFGCMLRITTQKLTDSTSLKLEGTLKGPWVDELQKAWSALADKGKSVNVDLHGVSFVDASGRDLLLAMQREGSVLNGASGFLRNLLEQTNGKPQNLARKRNRQ